MSLKVPYRAQIRLKGVSEANFEHPLQGKTQHTADAGTVCSWIKKYGGAKEDAMEFDADPSKSSDGIASIRGIMRVDQAVNFTIFAIDVTSTLTADPSSADAIGKLLKGEQPDNIVSAQPVAA